MTDAASVIAEMRDWAHKYWGGSEREQVLGYAHALEAALRERDEEIARLRAEIEGDGMCQCSNLHGSTPPSKCRALATRVIDGIGMCAWCATEHDRALAREAGQENE